MKFKMLTVAVAAMCFAGFTLGSFKISAMESQQVSEFSNEVEQLPFLPGEETEEKTQNSDNFYKNCTAIEEKIDKEGFLVGIQGKSYIYDLYESYSEQVLYFH